MAKRVIEHVYIDEFELEGFYLDGKYLQGWCANDAHWRSEYMDPLIEALGFKIKISNSQKLKKDLIEVFGLTSEASIL
jgi:hypothetical protein